jgi:radical SAM superfamily enzyme YgiQ (UPF0313 family)
MTNAENRAARQTSRFPGLDLYGIQKDVHKNLSKVQFQLDGKFMGMLDLMNWVKNGRQPPKITRENSSQYYSLANMITLNGIYLYQFLLSRGYEPQIIQNYALADLPSYLSEKPLAVCISSTLLYLDDIREIATQIKSFDPQIPVIAGGILVKKVFEAGASLSAQTLRWLSTFHGKVDAFVVEAQGEETLIRLLEALRCRDDWTKIQNLAVFDDSGKILFSPRQQESSHIDGTAIAWDKIPAEYLRKTLPVNTSRGCLFRCRFCSYHRLFPETHYKSLDVLREELRLIDRLGLVKHVRFTDDNFTGNVNRLKSALQMMIEENFDFTWSSFARASSITPAIVKLMKDSGCDLLTMGIESGSQKILESMDKRLKRDQVIDAIHGLNDAGIYSEGGFIVGYPGETRETFAETMDLIQQSALPYYHPFLFYYSKDMLIHEEKEDFGLQGLGRAWQHKTMDAATASQLMTQLVRKIDRGFSNGFMGSSETFRLLRGDGYLPDEIFELFRLKRELQLAVEESPRDQGYSSQADRILGELRARVK